MRFLVVAMFMIVTPAARAAPVRAGNDYTFVPAPHGTALALTFTNVADHAIHIPVYVATGGGAQYDWLTVELEDAHGTKRVLRFVDDRDRSAAIYTDLAAGASTTQTVDLQAWAVRRGAPLAPGTYRMRATWDTMGEKTSRQSIASTATLVVAAPVEKLCNATGTGGLELLARQDGTAGVRAMIGLHNTGDTTLCVAAAMIASDMQSDWMTITIGMRTLRFDDNRNGSGRMLVELPPGATTWLTWDLDGWARRVRNGAAALARGEVWATVVYDVPTMPDAWHGRIATSVRINVP